MNFKLQLLVFALAMTGLIYFASAQPAVPDVCGTDVQQERIRGMMFEAVDAAFKEQIGHLYSVWMKDERGQPHRASVGAHQGISSYVRARQAVETWKLAPC